jgi:hypothetical protein
MLGHREYYVLEASDKNISSLIEEVRTSIKPQNEYHLNIHLGKYNVNVVAEISGADPDIIRKLDLAVSSKIVEICEKRGLECHLIEPLQII